MYEPVTQVAGMKWRCWADAGEVGSRRAAVTVCTPSVLLSSGLPAVGPMGWTEMRTRGPDEKRPEAQAWHEDARG